MEKNTNLIVISLLVLTIGFGGGYFIRGTDTPLVGNRMMQGGGMMSGNIDRHFIEQMISHHDGAIAMAKIALERSKRTEILSLAKGIIEAQERENRDMRSWYQSWFGSAPSLRNTSMMHMGSMEGDTEVLKSVSASNFDREFMEQMIPHHEMAIMMAQMLQSGTERNEMKKLADNIITSQSQEIEMMLGWLKSWYSAQ